MSQHTPAPWKLSRGAQADAYAIEGPARTIAHVKHGRSATEDAEFIVRAVNAHETLVRALKLARVYVPEGTVTELDVDAALNLAKAAR